MNGGMRWRKKEGERDVLRTCRDGEALRSEEEDGGVREMEWRTGGRKMKWYREVGIMGRWNGINRMVYTDEEKSKHCTRIGKRKNNGMKDR